MGGDNYDKNNSIFKPISDNLQFLIKLLLQDVPDNARVLCVGVGTGADIVDLARANTSWSFVGIDPAASMLKKCEEKLIAEGVMERCELIQGYLSDYHSERKFDVVLCLFVMHFVKEMNERARMYADMAKMLKNNGILVSTEISADFKSIEYKYLLENWKALHGLAGSPKEKLAGMGKLLEEQLAVLSLKEIKEMISRNGFENPVSFFQSFLIQGIYAQRSK